MGHRLLEDQRLYDRQRRQKMINVTVHINGSVIISRSARNTQEEASFTFLGNTVKKTAYLVDDGRTIWHNPDDGAAKLAVAMLEGVTTI
jgi:hypothetical protein